MIKERTKRHDPNLAEETTAVNPYPIPCLTFIQPVTEAIVNDTLLPGGDHPNGLLSDMCTVVDIVFKDKYLCWTEEKKT